VVKLVIVADPERRTVETYEADAISYFTEHDTLTSERSLRSRFPFTTYSQNSTNRIDKLTWAGGKSRVKLSPAVSVLAI
jgi:hypothetical protein